MKLGMTRWKEEPLKPKPFSPVQSARKFSVWGNSGWSRWVWSGFSRWSIEAFFDGGDSSARKSAGAGGNKDEGDAIWATGRTGGLGDDVRTELWTWEGG